MVRKILEGGGGSIIILLIILFIAGGGGGYYIYTQTEDDSDDSSSPDSSSPDSSSPDSSSPDSSSSSSSSSSPDSSTPSPSPSPIIDECRDDFMKKKDPDNFCQFSPDGIKINDGGNVTWNCPSGLKKDPGGSGRCIYNSDKNSFIAPEGGSCGTTPLDFGNKDTATIISDLESSFNQGNRDSKQALFKKIHTANTDSSKIIRSQFIKQICDYSSPSPEKPAYKCNKNDDGSDCTDDNCWTIGLGDGTSFPDCDVCRQTDTSVGYMNINNKKILKKNSIGDFECDYNKCNHVPYDVDKPGNFVSLGKLVNSPTSLSAVIDNTSSSGQEFQLNNDDSKEQKIFNCSRNHCKEHKFFSIRGNNCTCLNYDPSATAPSDVLLKTLSGLSNEIVCPASGTNCDELYTTEVNIDGIGCIHEEDRSAFYFDKSFDGNPNTAIQWLSSEESSLCDNKSKFECREDKVARDKCAELNVQNDDIRWEFDQTTKKCKCKIPKIERITKNNITKCEKEIICDINGKKFPLSADYNNLVPDDQQICDHITMPKTGACVYDIDQLCNGAPPNPNWNLNDFITAIKKDYDFNNGALQHKSGHTDTSHSYTVWKVTTPSQFPFDLSYRNELNENWIHLCNCGVETDDDVSRRYVSPLKDDSDYLLAWQYANPYTNCHCSYGHVLDPASTLDGKTDKDVIIIKSKQNSDFKVGDSVYWNYTGNSIPGEKYKMIKGTIVSKTSSNASVSVQGHSGNISVSLDKLNFMVDEPIDKTKNAKCIKIPNDVDCSNRNRGYGEFFNYTKPYCSVSKPNEQNEMNNGDCCDRCSNKVNTPTTTTSGGGYKTYNGQINKLPKSEKFKIQNYNFSRRCNGNNCVLDNIERESSLSGVLGQATHSAGSIATMNPLFASKTDFLTSEDYGEDCKSVGNHNYCEFQKRKNIMIDYGNINQNGTNLGNYEGMAKGYNSRKLNWTYDTSNNEISDSEFGTNRSQRKIFNPYGGLKIQKYDAVPAWNAGSSAKSPSEQFGKILTYETEHGFKTHTERIRQNIFFCRKSDPQTSAGRSKDPIQNTGAGKPGGLLSKPTLASENTTNYPIGPTQSHPLPQKDERYFEIHNIDEGSTTFQSQYLYDWNVNGNNQMHWAPNEKEEWRVRSENRNARYAWNKPDNWAGGGRKYRGRWRMSQGCIFDDSNSGNNSTIDSGKASRWTREAREKNQWCDMLRYRVPTGFTQADLNSESTNGAIKRCNNRGIHDVNFSDWSPYQNFKDFHGCTF